MSKKTKCKHIWVDCFGCGKHTQICPICDKERKLHKQGMCDLCKI